MISIIIPTLNEGDYILKSVKGLQNLRKEKVCEIIIIDGGSNDDTLDLVFTYVDKIFSISPSRSLQQNLGASLANGNLLLFLHADTILNEKDLLKLREHIEEISWGYFLVSLGENMFKYKILEKCINMRSKLFKYATGDQGIFIKKELFEMIGGFPNINLMEDIAICKLLKKNSPPHIFDSQIITSSRRWKENGFLSTILQMRLFRLLYAAGVSPNLLGRHYQ
ncbi:MAG: TIGR04283 family arsenosugar biosynthesis glycosyltransferase [Pseudomonadota bacterium]|nr:TIGR04283 family arsenosugar biosynthesis glycosyltransferase [Pseudomonadota bacterium]